MDIKYYRGFNKDLERFYKDSDLEKYFSRYWNKEERIYNEETFYKKYPEFDYEFYSKINCDLYFNNKFDYQKHFHFEGYNDKRVYNQKIFNEKYFNFNLEDYKNNNLISDCNDDFLYVIDFYNKVFIENLIKTKMLQNIIINNYNDVTFIDVDSLDFRKYNIYIFDESCHYDNIFQEYFKIRKEKNVIGDAYTNLNIHTDYLYFIKKSIIDKKITINCPFTNKVISSDTYIIYNVIINDFKIPHSICNYIFDNNIILGISLGTGPGAMETRILYIYSIIHKKVFYNWKEYSKELFTITIISKLLNFIKNNFNEYKKNNNNESKVISLYGYMANLGHYLFNDITGLFLLDYYNLIEKIDIIYFGSNDNYFVREFIKNKYPNINIIENNDDYLNFIDGFVGKGVCFKYNHYFISNKCLEFFRNNLIANIKTINNYIKNPEIDFIKNNYYPIINIVLREGMSKTKNIMYDCVSIISRFINKMNIMYPKAYFFLDGFCGSPYLNNTLLGENEGFSSNDLINKYKLLANNIIKESNNKNCKSLINMYSYELIDYLDIVHYSIYQVGSACTISGWICGKPGIQFGRKDVKIYYEMDKNLKEENLDINYYMDSDKITFSDDYLYISEDTIIENINKF